MNILIFDIETIPDIEGAGKILGIERMPESEIFSAMCATRMQETNGNSNFIRLHLHKIVAISVALKTPDRFEVLSIGDPDSTEQEIISKFFSGLEKYNPLLVSWNGSGFDLPVLHYRALVNKVVASHYWENGDSIRDFKYNNYRSRYHERHIDLMDVLSGYQPKAFASLDDIATILGFPGKIGLSGKDVYQKFKKGKLKDIRDYCESDVLTTWLVYLRFEYMRANLKLKHYEEHIELTKNFLKNSQKENFKTFLKVWNDC